MIKSDASWSRVKSLLRNPILQLPLDIVLDIVDAGLIAVDIASAYT